MYEILDHTADIKIRITSINLFDFFKDLISALKYIINYEEDENQLKSKKENKKNIKIILSDLDDYQKVFNFISKFIYYLDAKSLLITDVNYINLKEDKWEISVKVKKINKKKIKGYLKAPTYHDFKFISNFELEVIIDV
jgi:SHS2 domain-containing protein